MPIFTAVSRPRQPVPAGFPPQSAMAGSALSPSLLFGGIYVVIVGAALGLVLTWKRRQDRALEQLSREIVHVTRESGNTLRIRVEGRPEALGHLGSAVNGLLDDLGQRNARMQDREQLFERLVETVHDPVLVHRKTILYANARFLSLLGAPPENVIGRPLADFVATDYVDLVDQNLRRRLAGEPAAERYEVELVGTEAQVTRVELSGTVIDRAGQPTLLMTALEMLPAAPAAVAMAPASPVRSRSLATLDAMGESVITVDRDGRIDYVNPSAAGLLGQTFEQVAGKSFPEVAELVDEADRRSLGDLVGKAFATMSRVSAGKRAVLVPTHGGAERSVEIGVSPLRADDDAIDGVVIVLHDTSELRGLTRQMTYQASHDALTGLVNRREFEHRLQEALESAQAGDGMHALAYLDLDRFKAVNDTCGHTAGDNMLREVATLIKDAVRDSDTVGRIGGDEFALLLVGCPLEKARQIADDVVRSVRDYRFVWRDKIFNIGVSVGLVEIGRDCGALEDLLSAADSACYVAKKQGAVHVYSAREEANARHRGEIHWLQKLQGALRNDKFELFYQPIVHVREGGRGGPAFEVFVRLEAENGQPAVPPAQFIRAAERYRLMPLVDRWVVQAVFAALGRGGLKLPPGNTVAINIAGQTLGDSDFLEFVVECFDKTGASPEDICFEVTESAVVANLDHARRFIEVLHGMGCEFALDDFGSGLSSFATLRTLPMDYLKIDGSFMRNLADDSVNQAVVAAMIELSRSLNFRVVAEQVEDQSCLDAVRTMGIDFVQGFIIARPQPLPLSPAPAAVPL
jgi:diguanylate cyclase (GGDEF)-like protein/PAS domain S-box-containing protein